MRVVRLLLCLPPVLGAAGALAAQIPTRRPPGSQAGSAARMLVGNPHSFVVQDSGPSVTIGEGLRARMEKLASSQFRVLTRAEMNEALITFGYPADAILGQLPSRSLAQSLGSRAMVFSTLARDAAGRYTVTSRFAGMNDDAGTVVVVSQSAGQSAADLGSKVAEGFAGALKAWSDARACVDQSQKAPEKAVQSARRALGAVPSHGLANFCLGMLALAGGKKPDSVQAMGFFEAAVKGDPLSLAAWTQLAAGHEAGGDTTRTVDALKQMLLIAPTNQPLRELAFKKFLGYGRPEIAEQVAEEGLRLDPGNVDLVELRANARIFREDYAGALNDLDQILAQDSTRADSTFYLKYLVTAGARPDTARLLRVSSVAMRKFPDNGTLVRQAAASFGQIGAGDSLLIGLNLLVRFDTAGAVGLALQEAKNRQDAKDFTTAGPLLELAGLYGDAQAREGAAGLMLNGTLPLLQPPQQDFTAAAAGLRRVVALANPQGRYAPIANYFLGLSLVNLIAGLDQEAEKQKSCDLAKQVEQLTAEASGALTLAASYQQQEETRQKLLKYIGGTKPRTASMLRAYCR